MAVLSNEIYSPQNFIGTLTDKYYIFKTDVPILEEMCTLLCLNGLEDVWDYPLTDVNLIVEGNLDVVLVDVSDYDIKSGNWVTNYRWFRIPESYCNKFSENS